MHSSRGWREWTRWAWRLPLLGLAVLLAACSDAGTPLEPVEGAVASVTTSSLTGTYETRSRVPLADGRSVYLVGVYFGDGARADGRTYLAQVGLQEGGSARLLMEQRTYSVVADSLGFGSLLRSGRLSADGRTLQATLLLGNESVQVSLARR